MHIVYLITEQNIYTQKLDMEKIDVYPRELQFLTSLYQNIISKIREAGVK